MAKSTGSGGSFRLAPGTTRGIAAAVRDPDSRDRISRSYASSSAAAAAHHSNPRITYGTTEVKLLLEARANVNKALPDGATPLFFAAQRGNLDLVNLLLESGADIERGITVPERAETRATPLKPAVGACPGFVKSPLFVASEIKHVSVVQRLLAKGANVDTILAAEDMRKSCGYYWNDPPLNLLRAILGGPAVYDPQYLYFFRPRDPFDRL